MVSVTCDGPFLLPRWPNCNSTKFNRVIHGIFQPMKYILHLGCWFWVPKPIETRWRCPFELTGIWLIVTCDGPFMVPRWPNCNSTKFSRVIHGNLHPLKYVCHVGCWVWVPKPIESQWRCPFESTGIWSIVTCDGPFLVPRWPNCNSTRFNRVIHGNFHPLKYFCHVGCWVWVPKPLKLDDAVLSS